MIEPEIGVSPDVVSFHALHIVIIGTQNQYPLGIPLGEGRTE